MLLCETYSYPTWNFLQSKLTDYNLLCKNRLQKRDLENINKSDYISYQISHRWRYCHINQIQRNFIELVKQIKVSVFDYLNIYLPLWFYIFRPSKQTVPRNNSLLLQQNGYWRFYRRNEVTIGLHHVHCARECASLYTCIFDYFLHTTWDECNMFIAML